LKTILFIEDEAGQRELTTRLYQMCRACFHGEVEFLTADSWEAGMKLITSVPVDVVILDLVLPPFDWKDTLKSMSKTTGLPPVVILTGHSGMDGLREKCFEAGAEDFMVKTEVNRHPEMLCERVYHAALRR
jgi:DNA-binding response OmpR family regulator